MLPKSLLSALLGACSFKPGKLQRHQKHNHLNVFLVRTVGVMTEKKKKKRCFCFFWNPLVEKMTLR